MEYNEAIQLLDEMKSRFDDGFSSSDRDVIEQLYREVLHKVFVKIGCGDCYRDAFILIHSTLRKLKEMPTQKSNYVLKAGALLRKPGHNRFYANPLPNDEIPESFLAANPESINLFAAYPSDWEERVEKYKSSNEIKSASNEIDPKSSDELDALRKEKEEKDSLISLLENKLAESEKEIADLKALLSNSQADPKALLSNSQADPKEDSDEVFALKTELEVAQADLKAANEEIEALRAANEALKASKSSRTKKA